MGLSVTHRPLNGHTQTIQQHKNANPYEYFIPSLHQEGQLIPEQHPGEKNLLLQLAIDPSYTPLEETSQATSFIPYTQCHVATLRTQPTRTLGHYTTCCKSQS